MFLSCSTFIDHFYCKSFFRASRTPHSRGSWMTIYLIKLFFSFFFLFFRKLPALLKVEIINIHSLHPRQYRLPKPLYYTFKTLNGWYLIRRSKQQKDFMEEIYKWSFIIAASCDHASCILMDIDWKMIFKFLVSNIIVIRNDLLNVVHLEEQKCPHHSE